jgi:hypothetical protein
MSSSKTLGTAAVLVGVGAIAAVPVAVAAAQLLPQVTLLQGLYVGTPISVALGLLALLLVRRARIAATRSIAGGGPLRLGRLAAWSGLYVGVTAAIALGVYSALVAAQ